MPSLQQTRRRIGSVKNTQKITKAMKLVSAAKLRRAQERILAARPYADQMAALLAQLGRRVDSTAHPLLRQPDGNKVEIIVVSADRGLCGSFNAQVFRNTMELAQRLESEGRTVSLTTIGKKARDFFLLGYGGTPTLLPESKVYISNPALRFMYRSTMRFIWSRALTKHLIGNHI